MKNRIVILLFALGTLLVSSCSDAYDFKQNGEQNNAEDVYKTPEDVLNGITAIYASIPGETEVDFVSTFTDEVSIGIENGGQGIISGEYAFKMEPGNAYATGIWDSYYAMINRINRLEVITKNLLKEETVTLNINSYNSYLAELYVLRAYAHYKLFAYFTPNYTNASGLSVVKLDHVPPLDYNYALERSTVSEIVKFIEDDLSNAVELRKDAWRDSNYANAEVINSILVKLYAMTENWDGVISNGTLVLQKIGLANTSQYLQIFPRTQTTPSAIVTPAQEIVFQLKRTANSGGNVASAWYSGSVSATGSPFYEMGRSLYNELDALDVEQTGTPFPNQKLGNVTGQDRNDVRYEVNLDPATTVRTDYESLSQGEYEADVLLIGKYQGLAASGATLRNSIPLFRSSDILLAMAEARAAKGEFSASSTDPDDLVNDYSSVYSIIYNIRFYRSTDYAKIIMPNVSTAQAAFNAILKERRMELAFEGQRYLDMKRLGVKAGSEGFTRYSKDCFRNGACNLPVTDHRMTLPIPVTEMNGNHVIKAAGQQNPGY